MVLLDTTIIIIIIIITGNKIWYDGQNIHDDIHIIHNVINEMVPTLIKYGLDYFLFLPVNEYQVHQFKSTLTVSLGGPTVYKLRGFLRGSTINYKYADSRITNSSFENNSKQSGYYFYRSYNSTIAIKPKASIKVFWHLIIFLRKKIQKMLLK